MMSSGNLKIKGFILALCMASFILDRFLIPSQLVEMKGVGNGMVVPPVSRLKPEKVTGSHFPYESKISSDLLIPALYRVPYKDIRYKDGKLVIGDKKVTDGRWPILANPNDQRYLAKVNDSQAAQMLGMVVKLIPPDIMSSVAHQKGLKYDKRKSTVTWPSRVAVQTKWDVLISGMQHLGYEQRLPTIICLGVKKSGTTAFLHDLARHPQIVRTIWDEVHYFSLNYDKGIGYYRSRMGFSTISQAQLEKSPSYFVTKEVPGRILKDLPTDVKFVLCVRDPVERIISDFRHEYELKLHRGRAVVDMIRASRETPASQAMHFVETIFNSTGDVDPSTGFVDESTYSKHMKNWLKSFPRDRFYVLSHERVNEDLFGELKNIEEFLGLEPFYERSMFYYDEERKAPCMSAGCPPKSTPGFLPKADLSQDIIQKLREYFRPLNQEFEELTQMNFSWTNL
ncbi:heparan sulfate glucosamine 3-O-sulfotransferase 1-like [Acanthaster planci]|uniref:Heparan sulfate glucosamine 3-O-sulfotransferase 1-like n=1 Tax=Acanthaster planci TaxID=133434 RepID=A0A8B7YVJ9_ACAPL|nr:heparan sulfate glucosamine 3-O-sulfotransferase 1-like [Acanthaster planci]